MIINTENSTYYVLHVLEDKEDVISFRGFKNIRSLETIKPRKVNLKKSCIRRIVYLKEQVIFIENKESGDIKRLLEIKDLVTLNKDKICYLPITNRDLINIYNKASKKFFEVN